MTEDQWNGSLCPPGPQEMLEFLRSEGTLSGRKSRLLAAACCRRVWDLLDEIGKGAVEVSERYADGAATVAEVEASENVAWWGADGLNYDSDPVWHAGWAAHDAVEGRAPEALRLAALASGDDGETAAQCQLMREVFGDPFRPLPPIDPSLLARCDSLILKLAQAAYDDRLLPSGHLDAARLAVLADALEDVGAHADLVAHLRGPGPHVRGCFLLDPLLGRE